MGHVGVTVYPVAWGLAAACAEFFGGILLILGLLFRPATFLLLVVMTMATLHHWMAGDEFKVMLHPIELACVFLGLFFVGPGRYSIDGK
jgi:putative oxidoreductase